MSATPPRAFGAGAVATSHHLATDAAAAALHRGGNAIDAAVAAAAALCVVYPNNVALGGDLVALVLDPEGRVRFVNATGRAPAGESLDALRQRHGGALPDRGIDTVTVPGGVRGWEALLGLGGRLPLADLLESAIRYAEHGVLVARSVGAALRAERDALAADPGCREVLLPGGEPLGVGDLLVQPALAATLRRISEHGPDEFYTGATASAWIGGLRALGSKISAADAAGYRPVVEDPIAMEVLGVEVLTAPPNTQGFSLLRTLEAITRDRIDDPLGRGADELARVFLANNGVRDRWLADPDASELDARSLLGMEADEFATADGRVASGDTVGLVAVSDDGWAVSLVQSVYWAFGACILDPRTGILFQNRGTAFSLDPLHPAAFAPGRRPPHTLMPVLVRRDGRLAFANATMGGQAQPQIHAHLLLRLLAGASAVEATSAARWVVGAQDDGDTGHTLTVETDVPDLARSSLDRTGLDVKIVPPRDERLGHANVIRVLPGGLDAASDPRSDGSAILVAPENGKAHLS